MIGPHRRACKKAAAVRWVLEASRAVRPLIYLQRPTPQQRQQELQLPRVAGSWWNMTVSPTPIDTVAPRSGWPGNIAERALIRRWGSTAALSGRKRSADMPAYGCAAYIMVVYFN